MSARAAAGAKESTKTQPAATDPTEALQAALSVFNDDWDTGLNLHGKLAVISGHIGRLPKNGHNSFNDYWYVLESDLVESIRAYLSAARILIFPSVKAYQVVEGQVSERRSGDARTDILFEFRVVDGKTGQTFTFDWLGQGSDPRDKGANKASTSAMKFAYMRLFNLSSGEDPENDAKGDQRAAGDTPVMESVTVRPTTSAALSAVASTDETTVGAPAETGTTQRGGKQDKASSAQIRAVSQISNQLNLGATGLVEVIKRVLNDDIELPDDETKHSNVLASYLGKQTGEDVGKLIFTLQAALKESGG